MFRPYKYRLYPFKDQVTELERQFGELRFLWNYALGQRQDAWRKERKSVSYYDQQHSLSTWRSYDKAGLGRVYGHVAQDVLAKVEDAYRAFFRNIKRGGPAGYPKFKHIVTSLCYPDGENGSVSVVEGRNRTKRLHLSKIGDIPIVLSRDFPVNGKLKRTTIEREGERWFAVLCFELPDSPLPTAPSVNPVGIDVGLHSLLALSNGETVEPPRFLISSEKRLCRAQRNLSRKQKGSSNWHKQVVRVARIHQKVREQRKDFSHKLTTSIADRFDLVAMEDLRVGNMLRNHHLAKGISDAGWSQIRQQFSYKMPDRSARYVEVDARLTTQSCSECGHRAWPALSLRDRVFRCNECGHEADRDTNASSVILQRGIDKVAADSRKLKPAEIAPPRLPLRKKLGMRVRSRIQEPPTLGIGVPLLGGPSLVA